MRKVSLGLLVVLMVGCGAASRDAASPKAAEATGGASYPAAEAPAGLAQPGYPAPDMGAPTPMAATTPAPAAPVAPTAGSPAKKSEAADAAPSSASRAAPSPIAVSPPPPPPPPRETRLPQAGQLTAGVWDDNRNFDFFKPYMASFKARNGQDFAMFVEQEMTTARDAANGQQSPHTDLDVQLVLDTTGSMGDELSYLQSEFDAIAARIRVKFPNVTPRWSLVVYRDHGDEYLTRQFDFTTNTTQFRKDLRAQSAGGGGDTPEAVVEGLGVGLKQSWRQQNNVAKLAFWVADAPAHPGEGKVLASVIRDAKKKGVHIYPIASSDADDAAEYQMRSAAQMTGGRYVFLTNDSGIGNSHAEPHIPCYNVTRLDTAIVRMIEVELSGRHIEPEQNEVIRAVGKPNKEGKCTTSSGMLVASF